MRRQAGFEFTAAWLLVMGCCGRIAGAADAELILHHGKIVTVDELYLDTRTLVQQFGYDRLRWFQPLRSLFEAGAIAGG